jgi:hypothetical protein
MFRMKKIILVLAFFLPAAAAFSQTSVQPVQKLVPLDKSPMDMAYFPVDYPMLRAQGKMTEPALARVIYSRPQRDNRKIFGELVEYGQVWRMGANEATEVEFFRDVTIGGKKLPKGRYTLYSIPNEFEWTIIINKDTDSWGAFIYDMKKDVMRVNVPAQKTDQVADAFTISFVKSSTGASLVISWDNVIAALPIAMK